MAREWHTYNMNYLRDATEILHELQRRWQEMEQIPNLFRYKLNVRKGRVLDGKYGFLVELNVERGTQRRAPIPMPSLRPPIDKHAFNFTKINPDEKLLDIRFKDFIVSILINQAPVTKYNCLLVPRLDEVLPQVMTIELVEFSIRLLRVFNSRNFVIGYNSPGAAASVNHLHAHLMYHASELFAQHVELERLRTGIYRVHPRYEVKALCFVLDQLAYDEHVEEMSNEIFQLVDYMLNNNIPHNMFFTLSTKRSMKVMRVFVYPHDVHSTIKDTTQLNVAFMEFAGEKIYNEITEEMVVNAMTERQGDALDKLVAVIKDPLFYAPNRKERPSNIL